MRGTRSDCQCCGQRRGRKVVSGKRVQEGKDPNKRHCRGWLSCPRRRSRTGGRKYRPSWGHSNIISESCVPLSSSSSRLVFGFVQLVLFPLTRTSPHRFRLFHVCRPLPPRYWPVYFTLFAARPCQCFVCRQSRTCRVYHPSRRVIAEPAAYKTAHTIGLTFSSSYSFLHFSANHPPPPRHSRWSPSPPLQRTASACPSPCSVFSRLSVSPSALVKNASSHIALLLSSDVYFPQMVILLMADVTKFEESLQTMIEAGGSRATEHEGSIDPARRDLEPSCCYKTDKVLTFPLEGPRLLQILRPEIETS